MEDEDSVISLKDVIEEDQELQDTANAVLGDSDDTNCTYPEVTLTEPFTLIDNSLLSYYNRGI